MSPPEKSPPDPPVESLRRLARGILFDANSGDDLVQEAWLAALQARGEIRGVGAWLAGTVRRLALNRSREERRREHRERAAARAEALPSAFEASARIEVLQRLLEAVDRLDSPYREAIVLRYFDDQPPREIARRLGLPVNTARTHVRRGLERLRAELDPGPGREREALLSALVPLLGPLGAAPIHRIPFPTRSFVMQHPLWIAGSAIVLGGIAWLFAQASAPGPSRGSPDLALASEPLATSPTTSAPATVRATEDQAPPLESSPSDSRATAGAWSVRGRVQGNLQPYPNAPLLGRVFAGGRAAGTPLSEERFQADDQGAFAWTPKTPTGLFSLEVSSELPGVRGWPARGWFVAGDPAPQDLWVELALPDATLHGTVQGPDGAPLADAWVAFAIGDEAHAVRSAADGSFSLPYASLAPRRSLCAWKEGLAPGSAEVSTHALDSEHEYVITLQPGQRLHGTVRGADGAPLVGAEVTVVNQGVPSSSTAGSTGGRAVSGRLVSGTWPSTRTDASGRYEIDGIHPAAESVLLRATAPDHRAEKVICAGATPLAKRDWDFILARSVTLTGRVRAGGLPCEGAWITVGRGAGELEAPQAWCDAEGQFTLTDVAPGPQHLWIWRRGFAQLRHDTDVRAGSPPLELELLPAHFVAGIVLAPDGTGAPWIQLFAEDASGKAPASLSNLSTRTGADGRFRLTDLPACSVALNVSAPGYEPLRREVELDRDDHVLQLVAKTQESTSSATTPAVTAKPRSGSGSLNGRLLDVAGNARAGEAIELVFVRARDAAASAMPWRATTDARGEFHIAGLPTGAFDARWARKEAGLTSYDLETRVMIAADEARDLELRPRGQATLRGTIEFLTQAPANTATASDKPIVFGPPPGGMPAVAAFGLRRVVKDTSTPSERRGGFAHDGRFEIEGLTAGEWRFEGFLEFAGENPAVIPLTVVTVPERGIAEIRLGVLYHR